MVVGSMTVEIDLVVLGGGPGGYVAAIRAAQLGKDVIIVEQEKRLGGVCLNHGCIPTKAIIHAASIFHEIPEFKEMGIEVKDFSFDINKMRDWKEGIIDKLAKGIKGLCDKYGIEVLEGKGSFVNSNELHIGGKSDVTTIKFKKAIIATGSSPIEVPGFSFENEKIMSSRDALDLKEIPKKLVVIGGGYIGTEMGTVYGKLGSEVHIVEMTDRLIPGLDKELVDVFSKRLDKFNITPHLKSKALGMEEREGKVFVKINEEGEEKEIECDKVLVVVGRKPNSPDLGLENTKVTLDKKGFIVVDGMRRTVDTNIFAIGDVAGQPMLAHKASREGKVAAEVIGGIESSFDNKVIPYVVFNDPEIASVGMTEEDAKAKGHSIKIGKFPFMASGKASSSGNKDGFIKVIFDAKTDEWLGAHMIGDNVTEMIAELVVSKKSNGTAKDLIKAIHPHPTMSEAIMEAAAASHNEVIHL